MPDRIGKGTISEGWNPPTVLYLILDNLVEETLEEVADLFIDKGAYFLAKEIDRLKNNNN